MSQTIVSSIAMNRYSRGGQFSDVLDAAGVLAADAYGTPANAIAVMARQSRLYADATEQLERQRAKKSVSSAT